MGLAFLVGSDQFITCSFAQVLQIPITRPIFIREVSNGMYATTSYYMALITATVLTFILYPIIVTITAFYYFGFDEGNFGDMLSWMMTLLMSSLAGGFWGFTFGTFMDNETAATQFNTLFVMMFCFGAGIYANTGSGMNLIVRLISYVSPMRYTTELLMSQIVAGKPGGDAVLDSFGFTWGTATCTLLLILWTITCFLVGWLSLLWRTRNY